MIPEVASSLSLPDAHSALGAGEPGDLVRGAIGGAFVIGVSFLAGVAVFRRSTGPVAALFMVGAAALIEFFLLGLFPPASPRLMVLLMGVFAASVMVFLSVTIDFARRNPMMGALMFAAALSFLGLGLLNLFFGQDLRALMRLCLTAVAAFAGGLILLRAIRGDHGARLLLPGAAVALLAPFSGGFGGVEAGVLTPHAMFSFGILASSLIALVDGSGLARRAAASVAAAEAPSPEPASHASHHPSSQGSEFVSNSQLAEVLDYAGVAVWDWKPPLTHHTPGLKRLLDLGPGPRMKPDTFMDMIELEDRARFEAAVLDPSHGDGSFDVAVRLETGKRLRLRGARAVDEARGVLERIVLFAEEEKKSDSASLGAPLLAGAAGAASAAVASKDGRPTQPALDVATALGDGDLRAAFQPIVSLRDRSVRGYEALLRAGDGADNALAAAAPEEIVSAADAAGKGGDLAKMMLKAAAEFLTAKRTGANGDDVFVAFNVSFRQLKEPGVADAVLAEISTRALAPKSLVLELTEADAIDDETAARGLFEKVRSGGAALAFDDFGAGFSSLSNLQKYAFDFLKVDKSFIEKLDQGDGEARKIVSALTTLAADLGMQVIAEGVANEALAVAASNEGCTLAQGYLFGDAKVVDDDLAAALLAPSMGSSNAPGKSADADDDASVHSVTADETKATDRDRPTPAASIFASSPANEDAAADQIAKPAVLASAGASGPSSASSPSIGKPDAAPPKPFKSSKLR